MHIQSLAITNFKSFCGKHTIDFAATFPAGKVTLLGGDNKAEPSLGANGVGKSTVFDAVSWCLFGKTLSGVSAGNVESKTGASSDKTSVSLVCSIGDRTLSIKRTRPSNIELDDEPITQQKLNETLRFDENFFNKVYVYPQHAQQFVDLSPAEKLAFFSDVLNLDVWSELADKAKDANAVSDRKVAEWQTRIEKSKTHIAHKDEELKETNARYDAWAKENNERLAALGRAISLRESKMGDLREAAKQTQTAIDESKEENDKQRAAVDDKLTQIAQAKGKYASLRDELVRNEVSIRDCETRVKTDEERIKKLEDEMAANKKTRAEMLERGENAEKQIKADTARRDEAERKYRKLEAAYRIIDVHCGKIDADIADVEARGDSLCEFCDKTITAEKKREILEALKSSKQEELTQAEVEKDAQLAVLNELDNRLNLWSEEKTGFAMRAGNIMRDVEDAVARIAQTSETLRDTRQRHKTLLDDNTKQNAEAEVLLKFTRAGEEEVVAMKNNARAAMNRYDDLCNKHNRELVEISTAEELLKRDQDELTRLRSEKNPHEEALEKIRNAIVTGKQTQKDEEESLRVETAQSEHSRFWIGKFKEIRLSLVDNCLHYLNASINNTLPRLGLFEWRVVFSTERETKSGGISRAINTEIYAANAETPSLLGSYSGGEQQRIRLAITLGFSDLLRAAIGDADGGVEVFDESTNHLSQSGVYALMETLAERAKEQNKAIIAIDHRSIDSGAIGKIVTVVKTETGSALLD